MKLKTLVATLVVISLFTTLISLSAAQEEPTISGFYILKAEAGSFEDNGDETYTLLLEEVENEIVWVISQPEPYMGNAEAFVLSEEWRTFDENFQAQALLQLPDMTVNLTLSNPSYDDMLLEMTFTATVNEIIPVIMGDEEESASDGKKGDLELPEEFEAATLAIVVDNDLVNALGEGARIMEEEGRVSRSDQQQRPGPPQRERATPTPAPGG